MFGLAPYRIFITKRDDGTEVSLWESTGKKGFPHWFHKYCIDQLGTLQPREENRVARFARISANSDKTFVCGRFQTGEYGFASELVNSKSKTVSHERTIDEAEMLPFFFGLATPKQVNSGVLILQRFRNFGMRGFFVPQLIHDFEESHKGHKLTIERLVPSTLMNTLLDGSIVKSMRFVRHTMPQAIEDALGSSGFGSHVSDVELVIKAERKGSLPLLDGIKEVVSGKKNYADVVSIRGWEYESIKLDLEYAGRRRTIDIGKPFRINPNIEITDDVQLGADGHPVWKDVLSESADFAGDLLSGISGKKIKIEKNMHFDQSAPKLTLNSVIHA